MCMPTVLPGIIEIFVFGEGPTRGEPNGNCTNLIMLETLNGHFRPDPVIRFKCLYAPCVMEVVINLMIS